MKRKIGDGLLVGGGITGFLVGLFLAYRYSMGSDNGVSLTPMPQPPAVLRLPPLAP
jgi:hypothetical protein